MSLRKILLTVLSGLFLLPMVGCDEKDGLLRLRDGARLSFEDAIGELTAGHDKPAMVFVGERHNSAENHRFQAAVVRALVERSLPVAVGLEMFRQPSQPHLDAWVAGKIGEEPFEKIFAANWNYPWKLYRDIFILARDRHIPMIALNVPPAVTRKVAKLGFDSLAEAERGGLPRIRCVVDPEYEAFIRRAVDMHGHGSLNFEYFCEAQLVWDVSMARALLAYHEQHPDRILVVVAGSGHAWKRGIPAQVAKESDVRTAVILPAEDSDDEDPVTTADADYLWLGE